jgi:hypothetical protein
MASASGGGEISRIYKSRVLTKWKRTTAAEARGNGGGGDVVNVIEGMEIVNDDPELPRWRVHVH